MIRGFNQKSIFKIDLKNGNFELTPDNKEHKGYLQKGKCLNKNLGGN